MPTTTRYALRYPGPYDTVTATSWQNLATDIDTAMSTVETKRASAAKPFSARVLGNSTQTMASATPTGVTFTTEEWDVGGIANLGVNNDRLTVGTGLWIVTGGLRYVGMTNVTEVECSVTLNGVSQCQYRIGGIYAGATPITQVVAMVICGNTTDFVGLTAAWIGTGGPVTITTAYLQATKVREYT